MDNVRARIQHVAPTLAAALGGDFAGVAKKFIKDHLVGETTADDRSAEEIINNSIDDTKSLQKLREIDGDFKSQMKQLGVDVFSLDMTNGNKRHSRSLESHKPQVLISCLFLLAYFLMLAAIFAIEASDTINMKKGENSLMGELQILFGVLTAGISQILSFWFGGLLGKKSFTAD